MSNTLLKEIKNIFIISLIMGIIQIIITIPIRYFGYIAILSTALGLGVAIFNFSLMGIIIERTMSHKGLASAWTGIGYVLRMAIIAVVVIWSMKVSYLNYVLVIIPLIFPQISIFVINTLRKKERKAE